MSDAATAPTVQLARPLRPGMWFADRFEVLAVLGHGGMGDVYRVRDHELAEDVALKLLRAEIADAPGAIERFRREVKLARRVTHPNVARTYDLGSALHEGRPTRFLTMELIVGEPLSRHVGPGRKTALADALRIVAEVARGLAAAHLAGVVHRDLKPDNVLLTHAHGAASGGGLDGRVVITDFGIARLADARRGAQTVGVTLGTPAYMAPEQVEGQELDGRADVYALGLLLHELLTGALPFTGATPWALAAARLEVDPADPRTLEPSLPEAVARLILDALSRRREQRPDAQGLLERVDTLRGVVPNVAELAPMPSAGASSLRREGAPRSSATEVGHPTPIGPRTIAVAPFAGPGAEHAETCRQLAVSLADALCLVRGARVLSPTTVAAASTAHVREGVLDVPSLGRAVHAELVLDGSLRVAADRIRVRVRLLDARTGEQRWAERFEGTVAAPFALEDAIVSATVEAVRARVDEAVRVGPVDPEARAAWERAKAAYARFALPSVREAVLQLEDAHTRFADDPWILSALGAALTRQWLQTGATDRSMIARAEEVSLRALAIDPSIGETFNTIGLLRLGQGELRAAVRAFQDALARAPLLAEAHMSLGRMLTESGHVEEGLRRLDVATRLDPYSMWSFLERARVAALLGDRPRAQADLARAAGVGGAQAVVLMTMRMAVWWNDHALALQVAGQIEQAQSGGAHEAAPPLLRAWVAGEVHPRALEVLGKLAREARGAPRHQAMMHQIACEHFATLGRADLALDALEAAAALPLTDLLWLDHCPALESLRQDGRFTRVRAMIAARCAELWS